MVVLDLRGILADAGVLEPPILDWFHIAMRLQHLQQISDGLAARDPARAAAKAVIVAEVERLHWRIWNGKAKNAREEHRSYPRSDASFPGRAGQPELGRAVAKALDGLTGTGQVFDWPERVAGQLCGTAPSRVESRAPRSQKETANFLVNRRMNKSQANALVTARRRPTAPGSVRSL